ncbi:MAG: LacI family DNA-binding transcriptional regulator [Spirochaetes bacterium]|nr:LacI family DNA-binding transcriptional regulator [Spirochaetota bacterium]
MGITIHRIAEESRTSIATVSKVLNNREGVSEQIRLKVLQTAERLGYFPYIKARESGLFRQKEKYIAEIFGHLHPLLLHKLKLGISNIVNNTKYYEVTHFLTNFEEKNINKVKLFINNLMRDNDMIGVIISFVKISDKIIQDLIDSKLYTVLINIKSDVASSIIIDNVKASFTATEYLIKTGCKKIGLIVSDDFSISVWQDRVTGYKEALKEYSINFNPNLIEYEATFEPNQIKLATRTLVEKNKDLDGIVYASDWQAFAGLQYLREQNIKVPDEISIIGFDNLEFDELIQPSLTSVDQPVEEMGQIATNLLIEMIKKKRLVKRNIILKSDLVIRDSTKKIKK